MRKNLRLTLSVALFFILHPTAQAAVSPIGLSIAPPVQFPASDVSVTGLRIGVLWGTHKNVFGFDFGGLGNITTGHFAGVSVSGIFNAQYSNTTITAIQAAGIVNLNLGKTTIVGLQVAPVNYLKESSSITGFQVAAVNAAKHTNIYGFQVGLYNSALNVYGFQIGVINTADKLHGLQIGLINFHRTGLFPICPGINIGI